VNIAVLAYWCKPVHQLWLARFRTIVSALVGTAGVALQSTARVELVGIVISALARERSGNFAWELAGTAGEEPEIRVTLFEAKTFEKRRRRQIILN